MAKKLNVNLAFSADTGNAKAEIQALQTQLTNLINTASTKGNFSLNTDLQQSTEAAIRLKTQLQSATNVKTGNLNLTKFTQELDKSGMNLEKYRVALENLGPEGTETFSKLAQAITTAEVPIANVNSKLAEFATTLKNTARWQISSSIMHGFMGSLQSAYNYAQNLDRSLNDIRIVTGQSSEQMAEFAERANQAAKELRTTTTAYTNASLIYYQQGLSDEEVKERTDTTIKMANVTGENATAVSDYMTAIWNNFDDSSVSLEHYADVITALGAATASSSEEIAGGLEKFASIADTVGLSYDYATTALATIVAQTRQSEDTVGTGLRTILSRFSNVTLGETLEDGVDLTKYTKALKTIGVDVLDNNDELKTMDEILNSIGENWQNISDTQKTALAQTVGGVRQYTTIMSLFDNWDVFKENLSVAQGAEGSLQEQADIYAESWQAAQKRVRASAEAIYQDLLNDKFFIAMNNGFAGFLDIIDKTIDSLGGLKGVLLLVSSIVTKVFSKQISDSVNNSINFVKSLTKNGRQNIENTRKEATEQLKKSAIDQATNEGESLSIGYEQQANLQDSYLKNAQYMDNTQKAIAKSLMEQQIALKENVKITGQQADQAEKVADAFRLSLLNEVDKNKELKKEDRKNINTKINEIGNIAINESAGQSIVKGIENIDVEKLTIGHSELTKTINELKNYSAIIDNLADKTANFSGAFGKEFETNLQNFKNSLNNIKDVANPTEEELKQLKTSMDNLIYSTDGTFSSLEEKKNSLINGLAELGVSEEQAKKITEQYIMANQALGDSYAKNVEQQQSLISYTEKVQIEFEKLKGQNASFAQSLSVTVGALTSVALTFSTVKNATNQVISAFKGEGDAIDAAVAAITALGMVTSTIISLTKAETVANMEAAASYIAKAAAAHPVATAIIAVTGAIVGVVAAAYFAIKNQETELDRLKEKYDQVTQATQDAKTAANEMQEVYSNLASTWDSYQTGIEKLSDLTVGTREYTEALHEANQEAWELIKAQNLQKDVDYIITQDSAGNDIVSLNEENIDKILEETERQAYSAQLISNAMQAQQNIAKENLDREEALQNAKDSVHGFSNFYTYQRTSDGGMDASGHQLTTTSSVAVRYEDKLMEIAKLLQEDDSKSSTKDLKIEDLKSIYTNANEEELEDILSTLQDSDDEIVKLVEALNNNTDALNESLVKEGVKGAISNQDAAFAGLQEGQQNAIINSLASTDEYNKKYNELLSSYDTDEIHKLYAEYLGAGAQYVETKDGTSTYLVNGEEQTFSDESAKMIIANKEALESLIDTSSETYKELLAAAQEMENNFQLSSSLKNNMLEFKGDYNANDGSTSAFDASLINTQDNEFLTAALKEDSEERKTLFSEMGDEEAKAYLNAFQKATKDNKITPESLKAADKATYDSLADSLVPDEDVDTDKLEKLTQYYEDYADVIEEVDDELKNNKYQSKQLAHEVERYSSAVADVVENYDDWKTQIKEISKKGGVLNAEDLETIEEVKNAMADMLDLDMSALSNDFVMSTENLELMKKAANGSEEAYNSLMLKAQQDIIANCSINEEEFNTAANNLENRLDELGFKKLEIGASLNDAEALAEMTNLINAAGMTAEQATSYLATMGIDAEIEEDTTKKKEVIGHNLIPSVSDNPIVGFNPMTGDQVTYNVPKIEYTTEPVETEKETSAFALKVTSAQKSSGGDFKYKTVKGNNGGARSSRRSGSRRSAPERRSATKKTTDDMKTTEKETERYHVLNNQLEDLEHQLNKISTAKDRAFGKNRLKYIDQEIKKYDQLIDKDKEYLAEVEKNLKKDKAAIQAYGAVFDENGTITNYEALMQSQINKSNSAYQQYNKQVDYYNSLSGSAQEKLDEQYEKKKDAEGNYYSGYEDYLEKTYIDPADKAYDKFLEILEQYEETQDLYKEKSEQLAEDLRAKYDLELEGVEYEIEVKVMIEDDALEYLDYLLKKVEDDAHETAEAIALLGDETQSYIAKSQLNESGIQKIFANHGLTDEDFAKFKAGDQATLDKIGNMEFTDDEVQAMRDYRSEIISLNETLIDTRNTIHDKVRDAFAEFNDELDEGINKIDAFKSITQSYLNIVDLVGQKNLGISNEILNNMGQSVVNQANNKLKATVDARDAIEAERDAAQKALEESRAKGYDEDIKQWEQTLKEMDEALLEAEQNVLSAWEDALTAANEAFENSVQLAINSLNTALGGLYANADELSEAFDRQKDLDDQYLEDFEQIYELTKLTREINKAIDDTDNIKGKQELAELLAEINDLEQKREELGENISEYDLEYLQKKLELKKAEIAMEDSQNAKSQVRMSRTYDGTWSYVYTANEEEVAAAEQSYEDKLYEMQRLNADYINTLQDNIVQMQTEMVSKLQEIATDESLSIEERQEKMDEVQAYYKEKMDYYTSEMGKVMDNNKELYNEDWQEYSVAHDYKIADDQRYVDSFNETALSTLSGYETMEQFQENFNNSIGAPGQSGTYLDDLDQAFKTWEDNTEETMNNAGTSMEDFSNTMQEEVQILEDKSDEAADSVSEMSQVVVDDMQEIIDAVMNWENQYSNTVDLILTKNEALVKSFNSVLQAWAGYKQGTGTSEADETTKNSSSESSSGSGSGSSKSGTGDGKLAIGDKVTFLSGSYFYDSYGTNPSGSKYHGKQVYITNLKTDGRKKPIHISTGTSLGNGDLGWVTKDQISGYDTGGYTGSWGDDGKLALLHEKELVLNKDDTENFLKIVGMVRQIAQVIDLNAGAASSFSLSGLIANGIGGNAQTLQQEIHINAEFPNATDRDEIKAAFESLAISASQYANRNRGL